MRQQKPTGQEIFKKSKESKLDSDNSFETVREGKKVKFTPVKMPTINTLEDLEEGQSIGLLEYELETEKLPKGRYNVFIAKVNENWEGYLETDGQIIKEAHKVSIKRHYFGDRKIKKPRFKFIEGSWTLCFSVCVVRVLIWCIVSVKICITIG